MARQFFVSYHNVATGVRMFSTLVETTDETDLDVANELLPKSNARLTHWNEKKRWGIFALGPLPGLIVMGDEPMETDGIGPRTATLIYEDAIKYPVKETATNA